MLTWKEGFNYAAINNFAAKDAKGSYLLFLNNDVEVITPGWIEEMLMICQQPDVAIVGAKLYYPDNLIQVLSWGWAELQDISCARHHAKTKDISEEP